MTEADPASETLWSVNL